MFYICSRCLFLLPYVTLLLDYITYLCGIRITKKGFVTRQFDKWSKIPKILLKYHKKNRQTAKLRFFLTNFDMQFYDYWRALFDTSSPISDLEDFKGLIQNSGN